MNWLWLGLGSFAGVLLWLATDRFILLILGLLMGIALGIGLGSSSKPD